MHHLYPDATDIRACQVLIFAAEWSRWSQTPPPLSRTDLIVTSKGHHVLNGTFREGRGAVVCNDDRSQQRSIQSVILLFAYIQKVLQGALLLTYFVQLQHQHGLDLC
jgi:hypothetical protein